jgi:hypothetical protein
VSLHRRASDVFGPVHTQAANDLVHTVLATPDDEQAAQSVGTFVQGADCINFKAETYRMPASSSPDGTDVRAGNEFTGINRHLSVMVV